MSQSFFFNIEGRRPQQHARATTHLKYFYLIMKKLDGRYCENRFEHSWGASLQSNCEGAGPPLWRVRALGAQTAITSNDCRWDRAPSYRPTPFCGIRHVQHHCPRGSPIGPNPVGQGNLVPCPAPLPQGEPHRHQVDLGCAHALKPTIATNSTMPASFGKMNNNPRKNPDCMEICTTSHQ